MRPRVFKPDQCPPYAVFSHCWKPREIRYNALCPKNSQYDDSLSSDYSSDEFEDDDDDDLDHRSHPRSRAASSRPPASSSRPPAARRCSRMRSRSRRSRSKSHAWSDDDHSESSDDEEAVGVQTPRTGISSDTRSEISASREKLSSPGMIKFRRALHMARREKIKWIWMDTCCVNHDSPGEVQEAIMGAWEIYAKADVCFVYLDDFALPEDLHDLDHSDDDDDDDEDGGAGLRRGKPAAAPSNWKQTFGASHWFTRAWTLLELLASPHRVFLDKNWENITKACGGQDALDKLISSATSIPVDFLRGQASIESATVAARMRWMAGRRSRNPEDVSYALAGIFGVHLDVRHGEGAYRAFQRLQKEILNISTDESILFWDSPRSEAYERTGLLADCPEHFLDTTDLVPIPTFLMPHCATWKSTNRGLQASLYMTPYDPPRQVGNYRRVWLNVMRRHTQEFMSFFVQQVGEKDEYARVSPIMPVSTRPEAFMAQRQQQTITVAQISDVDADLGASLSTGPPPRGVRGPAGASARSNPGTRPRIRFTIGSGLRQVVPYTPSYAPSWTVSQKSAECLAPIPHDDMYVSIVRLELKTPSHSPKIDSKFLVVACMRLNTTIGRWYCALRVDDEDDYKNEMPDMKPSASRALRDSPSSSPRTIAHLGVGLDGSREIRAEVAGWIEWHEKEFVVNITCPSVAPLGPPGAALDRERVFSASGTTPPSLGAGVGHLGNLASSAHMSGNMGPTSRSARFPGSAPNTAGIPPTSAGYPPSYSAYPPSASVMAHRGAHLGRSMSVDHGASPYKPPAVLPPHSRRDRDISPPPSLRINSTMGQRKRESWTAAPPVSMPPTPLSPPRRPMTARPGASQRMPARPPGPAHYGSYRGVSEYSPDYAAAEGTYDAPAPSARSRRDSAGTYMDYASDAPRTRADSTRPPAWNERYWDRPSPTATSPIDDIPAPPTRRASRTPAHGHSQSFSSRKEAYEHAFERDTYRERQRPAERERREEYAGFHAPLPPAPMPSSLFASPETGALGINVPSGSGPGRGAMLREGYGDEGWYEDPRAIGYEYDDEYEY
ncbi:hypothetical protein TD95_000338 [Thielaviopsis punctulata]|uniref:Heterokaryon incompatibility domain-containing protein n=1 Tax=Thielaviopsis punctulata TaxID=72032 RepID=A0A0F4Z859_9PEZI|nr:hypothetical protein TD95_000338 [Thielaviopsis punctulata]